MNIGFYGHSNCAYRSSISFIDLLENHYKANIVNIGVRQGSEERILFELKKTKNIDIAIIFHSVSQSLFLPDCDRDIFVNNITAHRTNYLFKNFNLDNPTNFINKFQTEENFLNAYDAFKKYFYHPDLQMNRYHGSMIQIDQYLKQKAIKCIHIIRKKNIPNWFTFESGIIEEEILNIAIQNTDMSLPNLMTEKGNRLVFKRLTELVEDLIPLLQVQ